MKIKSFPMNLIKLCNSSMTTHPNNARDYRFLRHIFFMVSLLISFTALSQSITVNSLEELLPYLDDDNVDVTLTPGNYTITSDDVANGTFGSTTFQSWVRTLLLFEGSNSTYDFTGVTINIETEVFTAFGNYDIFELQITGSNNVLTNLTMVDIGSVNDSPTRGALSVCIDGANNRIEGFHMTVKGSFPYGYGDAFGKGGSSVIAHRKHSALLLRGLSNHVKNSTIIHRAYGHAIFMQAADLPIIEGCYIEGEVRTTDDMLTEEGTGSPADNVDFMTVWGYKLPAGYTLSLQEEGIRAYNGGETIIDGVTYVRGTSNPTILDCTIKDMRAGVTLTHATGTKYVEGTTAIGCQRGFAVGSGDIINCSADAQHGPVFGVDYENDRNITADITILPYEGETYNGSKHLAIIIGSGHDLTFRSSIPDPDQSLKMQIGGDNRTSGLLSSDENYTASNITIKNLTNYPMVLDDNSSGCTGESGGMVTDLGTNNTINHIATSVLKIEAENYSDMNGVVTENTSDEGLGDNVTSINVGDWMEYEVDVPFAGTYSIDYRVASLIGIGDLTLSVEGQVLETVTFPSTGGLQTWATVRSSTPFSLNKGLQTIRITSNSSDWNINWINLLLECAVAPITAYVEAYNTLGGSLVKEQTADLTIFPGNTASLEPEPIIGGSWSWTGPNGFTAASRIVILPAITKADNGSYEVTFTNDCGVESTEIYNVNVQDSYLIEAETFTIMNGVSTETTTDAGGGNNVTSIDSGDWLEYEIDVPFSATYILDYRIASETYAGDFTTSIDGTIIEQINFDATGGAQTWNTVSSTTAIYLQAGVQTLRVTSNSAGWHINWIQIDGENFVSPCELSFSNAGFSIKNNTVDWSSGLMDISCMSNVNVYVNVEETGTLTSSDYLNVYYKLDGGEMISISENTGTVGDMLISVKELTGNTLELIIQASSESDENYYTISGINILESMDPFERTEAEDYDDANGTRTQTTSDVDGVDNVGTIQNDNWLLFENFDLNEVNSIDVRVASPNDGGTIEVRLDTYDGTLIGTIKVPNTGGWQSWETVSKNVNDVSGLHDVYLVFKGPTSYLFNINWFQFSPIVLEEPRDPFLRIESEDYDDANGTLTQATSDVDGVENIGTIQNDNWTMYSNLDISTADVIKVRVASPNDGGIIEVRLDAFDGQLISTIEVPNTGNWQAWTTVSAEVIDVEGTHDVYLVYKGTETYLFNVNWLLFATTVDPFSRIEAEDYDDANGTLTQATSDVDGVQNVGTIQNDNWCMYSGLDISNVGSIEARVASPNDVGTIEVRLDAFDGDLISIIEVPNTGGWQTWTTSRADVVDVVGTHDVYLVFKGESTYVFNINWFQFMEKPPVYIIDSNTRLEAENYSHSYGIEIEDTSDVDGGQQIGFIHNEDHISFDVNVLTSGIYNIVFRASSGGSGGRVAFKSNDVELGEVAIPNTGSWQNWQTFSSLIKLDAGLQSLQFDFVGASGYLFNVNWIEFEMTDLSFDLTSKTIGSATDNQIQTYLQIGNTGGTSIPLNELAVRYWFTAEDYDSLNFWCDYAQIGKSNVEASFVKSEEVRTGGYHYMELTFTAGNELLAGHATGVIQTRFSKSDWTAFDETNDYSYLPSSTFVENAQITMYKNGALIWGTEPVTEPEVISFIAEYRTGDLNAPSNNSLKPHVSLKNTGNVSVLLSSIKLKYWFTSEGAEDINFWVDWAEMGANNIEGTVYSLDTPMNGADRYLEVTFTGTETLQSLSSTGEIKTRLAKANWSNFEETDDHSYLPTNTYMTNDKITLYVDDALVWGIEPTTALVSKALEKTVKTVENGLEIGIYPNPTSRLLQITNGQGAKLKIYDDVGKFVLDAAITNGSQSIDLGGLSNGLYFMKIETEGSIITKKIIRK